MVFVDSQGRAIFQQPAMAEILRGSNFESMLDNRFCPRFRQPLRRSVTCRERRASLFGAPQVLDLVAA